MHVSRGVGVLVILLVAALGGGAMLALEARMREASPPTTNHKLEVIARLQARDFASLERAYELPGFIDRLRGKNHQRGFGWFAHSDPANREALNDWVEARPDEPIAYLARARYFRHLGWLSRGEEYISETHESRLRQMSDYFGLAKQDYWTALELRDDLAEAYEGLLNIAMAEGRRTDIEALRNAGREALGDHPDIHLAYVGTLDPTWGGSARDRNAYLEDLFRRFEDDPRYWWVLAYRYGYLAEALWPSDPEGAVSALTELLEKQDSNYALLERAQYLFWLERFEEARRDLERVLDRLPNSASGHYKLGRTLRYLGQHMAGRRAFEEALSLDPYNPKFLIAHVRALNYTLLSGELKDQDKEIHAAKAQLSQSLNRLLVYASGDPAVHSQRGFNFRRMAIDYRRAAESYKRAIELKPGHAAYWLDYAVTLYHSQDCSAHAASETYLEICRKDQGCQIEPQWPSLIRQHLDWCQKPGKKAPPTLSQRTSELGLGMKSCQSIFAQGAGDAALAACHRLAQSGDVGAQYDLGLIYVQGKLAVLDYDAALSWFALASQNGDEEATANLGGMFFRGIGVDADRARGVALWRQAAEAGVPAARFELAMAYLEGRGVEQDRDRGETMVRDLARAGFEPARRLLHRMESADG